MSTRKAKISYNKDTMKVNVSISYVAINLYQAVKLDKLIKEKGTSAGAIVKELLCQYLDSLEI